MIETWEADGLRMVVEVSIDPAAGLTDLSGATAIAAARRRASGETVMASAFVLGSEITVQFAPASLRAGLWQLQVRVTLGDEVQTVLDDRLRVAPSLT